MYYLHKNYILRKYSLAFLPLNMPPPELLCAAAAQTPDTSQQQVISMETSSLHLPPEVRLLQKCPVQCNPAPAQVLCSVWRHLPAPALAACLRVCRAWRGAVLGWLATPSLPARHHLALTRCGGWIHENIYNVDIISNLNQAGARARPQCAGPPEVRWGGGAV